MSAHKVFQIDVPQARIDRLKQKLSLAEFPDELDESGWDLGSPLSDIKRLTKVWEAWDWRTVEKELNQYPHFTTDINVDGFGNLNVHFIHQRSSQSNAIPLLFVHGCMCKSSYHLVTFQFLFQLRSFQSQSLTW